MNILVLEVSKKAPIKALNKVDQALEQSDFFTPINVKQLLHTSDKGVVYHILKQLKDSGLHSRCVYYTIEMSGNVGNLVYIWKIPSGVTEGELLSRCGQIIKTLDEQAPKFVSKLVKKHFMETYGFVASPVELRSIFTHLTHDTRAAPNLVTKEIDERFEQSLLLEEPGLNVDLRMQNNHAGSEQFEVFFKTTESYLQEEVGTAVQERRHSNMLF